MKNSPKNRQRISDSLHDAITKTSITEFEIICDETNNLPSLVDEDVICVQVNFRVNHNPSRLFFTKPYKKRSLAYIVNDVLTDISQCI